MKFALEFNMDNAAFEIVTYEVETILKKVASKISNGEQSGVIMDTNGNKVGKFWMGRDD